MRLIGLFIITTSLILCGCIGKNKVNFSLTRSSKLDISISKIQIINHQIIITGTNLNKVSSFSIKEDLTNNPFLIESSTATTIIANAQENVTFAAGKVLDFIFSNAHASATYSVNFSLCDSDLNGKGFNCSITPNDKEVLAYDAVSGKWKPRAVNGLSYKGAWDSTGALPTAIDPGDYYIVSVASGPYFIGDWIVFNGTTFDHIQNSNAIVSVFGRTGVVVAAEGDYNLTKMSDVDLTTVAPVNGNILKFNGTNWVAGAETDPNVTAFAKAALPSCGSGQVLKADGTNLSCVTDSTGAGAFTGTANRVVATNASGSLTVTSISDTLLGYLSGVTSNIQTQLNAKLSSSSFIDWTVAGLQTLEPSRLNLTTASRAVATNASGVPVATSVTATELGYVSGVTSSIQDQINDLADGAWTQNGDGNIYRTGSNVGIGTNDPEATLEIQGQVRTTTSAGIAKINNTTAIDWNNGNAQSMSVACTATTFTNMLDGGTYLLAVSETGTTTCTFSQAGLNFFFSPANGNRISGQRTVYTFQRIGSDVYVSWIAGFQ